MTQAEIIEFINKYPVFSLATASDNIPHVRGMMVAVADSRGLIFSTSRQKDVFAQLCSNPKIEMCFLSNDKSTQIRIEATAVETNDLELKKEIVEKFVFLKPMIEAAGYDVLAVFKATNARAVIWTMETMEQTKEYIPLTDL